MFCELCPEGCRSVNGVNGKLMVLEAEVNGGGESWAYLGGTRWLVLKNISTPPPQLSRRHKVPLCRGTLDAELCFREVFGYSLGARSTFLIK